MFELTSSQENPYILSGFREYTECSFLECSKSTFHIHNDTSMILPLPSLFSPLLFSSRFSFYYTVNIWTHLLAGLWAVSNKRKKRIIEEREGRRGGEDKQVRRRRRGRGEEEKERRVS